MHYGKKHHALQHLDLSDKKQKRCSQGDRFIPNRGASHLDMTAVKQLSPSCSPSPMFLFSVDEDCDLFKGESNNVNAGKRSPMSSPRTPRMLKFQSQTDYSGPSQLLVPGGFQGSSNIALTPKRKKEFEFPCKILTAPNVTDCELLHPIDWSKKNMICVALEDMLAIAKINSDDPDTCLSPETMEIPLDAGASSYISACAWDEQGDLLAVGFEVFLGLIDPVTLKVIHRIKDDGVMSLHWRSSLLACGSSFGTLKLFDSRKKLEPVLNQKLDRNCILKVLWRSDGKIALGTTSGYVKVYDIRNSSNPLAAIHAHSKKVKALAWCPWETFKLASGGINAEDTSVKIVDIDKGIVVETFETGGPVVSIIWNEEYKEISTALLNGNNTIKLWKACDFSLVGALGCPSAHQDKIISTVQSWNGTSIASLSCDETICIWKCWPKFSRKQNHEVRSPIALTLR
ncbi:cell division cycle protein 20 homolog isoform X2 [Artemia franciscana]|uniref:cell division cycle protein 20 homolog isoform X2 n=1 Tax=Artemia franciscana TaxID=6661 RepID=UPI0032DA1628